jgi:hypothetical protein
MIGHKIREKDYNADYVIGLTGLCHISSLITIVR